VATYKELKAQLAELELLAAAARQVEYHAVLDEIRAKVAESGFTERDIFGSRTRRGIQQRHVPRARYRDPKSGATWSGRGRPPKWIRYAKDREKFLIRESETGAFEE